MQKVINAIILATNSAYSRKFLSEMREYLKDGFNDAHVKDRYIYWFAMIGFVAAAGSYLVTGQIIPGVF